MEKIDGHKRGLAELEALSKSFPSLGALVADLDDIAARLSKLETQPWAAPIARSAPTARSVLGGIDIDDTLSKTRTALDEDPLERT